MKEECLDVSQGQRIVILDSPDATGKTEIGKALSRLWDIPYFKVSTEVENWRNGSFVEALRHDQTWALDMFRQTGYSMICDRAFPAEFVYSHVYGRETDHTVLARVDEGFAELGTLIVIPRRRNYSNVRKDELVKSKMLAKLDRRYVEFIEWTKCHTVTMFVDDIECQIDRELEIIDEAWDEISRTEQGWSCHVANEIDRDTVTRRKRFDV